jgi:hypothetical protein
MTRENQLEQCPDIIIIRDIEFDLENDREAYGIDSQFQRITE